jgi:transcription antitermination factor NusG
MSPIRPAESVAAGSRNGELPWFALQVRTRHETGVAGFLEAKGYKQFVPGYLFCRFDPQHRLPILKTPGVIQIVGYNRIPTPIDEMEIDAIQTLIASGLQTQPWPFLAVGERVRIESGALRGVDGIVVKMKENHRLVVSITLLRRSVAVEIDSALVEPYATVTATSGENQTKVRQEVVRKLLIPARLT